MEDDFDKKIKEALKREVCKSDKYMQAISGGIGLSFGTQKLIEKGMKKSVENATKSIVATKTVVVAIATTTVIAGTATIVGINIEKNKDKICVAENSIISENKVLNETSNEIMENIINLTMENEETDIIPSKKVVASANKNNNITSIKPEEIQNISKENVEKPNDIKKDEIEIKEPEDINDADKESPEEPNDTKKDETEEKENQIIADENWEINGDTIVKYTGKDSENIIIPNYTKTGTKITKIYGGNFPISIKFAGLLTISEGIEEINQLAFTFTDIKSVKLPNTLKVIGNGAFGGCSNLSGEINIPKGTQKIGELAFSCDTNISKIIMPQTLIEIGTRAFSGTKIKEITIPNSVKQIGNYLFEGSYSLTKINMDMPSTSNLRNSKAFKGTISDFVVEWKDGIIDTYINGILQDETITTEEDVANNI